MPSLADHTAVDTFFAHQQDWRLGSHGDSDIEGRGSTGALGTKVHGKFSVLQQGVRITQHFWPPIVSPFTKNLISLCQPGYRPQQA